MKKIILFIAIVFSYNLMGQASSDSINIPKSLIQQFVNYLPAAQTNPTNTITNPLDLSQVRTAGLFALSIPWGGLGRQLLVQMQNSPYDEDYVNKGLRVNPVFFAEIQINQLGEQIIVFRKK